jgi:hypothetical protein
MMRRGKMQHIIENPSSCRKGKASQKVWRWLDRQWTRVLPRIAHDLQSSRNSSQVMYGIHFKIIGNFIKRNIMPEMIIKLRNLGNLRKNVRQLMKMTGK